MPWIAHAHTQRAQRIPALANRRAGALLDEAWWRQVARKGNSLVQHQRYAIVGVTRPPDDLARNPDARIEQLQLDDASFDLVYSSLALHYVEALDAVCGTVQRLLTPAGHFVFSVEHPIITAPSKPGWQTDPAGNTIWPLN